MGKAENIKRAKLLKEAKRKREKEALDAAGIGPAGRALLKRNQKSGIESIQNTGKIKYSALLEEFVKPILTSTDDLEVIKTKYFFGILAWNAAILKRKSQKEYLKTKKAAFEPIEHIREAEILFDELVTRKEDEFGEYQSLILDIEIKKIRGNDYDLTVATTPMSIL